jgi:hypothetical protein
MITVKTERLLVSAMFGLLAFVVLWCVVQGRLTGTPAYAQAPAGTHHDESVALAVEGGENGPTTLWRLWSSGAVDRMLLTKEGKGQWVRVGSP